MINEDLGHVSERKNGPPPNHETTDRGHLLVCGTYFMGRQSVRLAKHIERWQKYNGAGIDVRYVNADSLLIGSDRPEMQ